MQSMLPGAPWLLAHKSMLVVNQPRKISLYGIDYVMWKDAAGDVHALPNACPHAESCYDLNSEKYWGWHGRSIDQYRRDFSEDGSDHRTESFDVNQ